MWTKNGKKLFAKQLNTQWTNDGSNNFLFRSCIDTDVIMSYTSAISGVMIRVTDGASYFVPDMTGITAGSSTYLKWQLYVGTGTTPPTEDDITLENPVAFTAPVNPQISRGDNYTTVLISYTLTNNTDETKTITEIGLCARVVQSSQNNPAVLFNRRLLDNPVVMNAGDSYTFSFTIDTSNLQD